MLGDTPMLDKSMQKFPTPRAREGNAGKPGSKGSKHNAKKYYLDGMIQEGLVSPASHQSISLAAGSPAKMLALLERARALRVPGVVFGRSLSESLASYDPVTSSWRTYQLSFIEDLTLFSETFPKSGTMRSGKLYPRNPLVRLTLDSEYSSWPTPTTQEVEHPDAELTESGRRKTKDGKDSHSVGLADQVRWRTPDAWLGRRGPKSKEAYYDSIKRGTHAVNLLDQVKHERWPTPDCSDRRSAKSKQQGLSNKVKAIEGGGQLNPTWVDWLMGFPSGWTDLNASETP